MTHQGTYKAKLTGERLAGSARPRNNHSFRAIILNEFFFPFRMNAKKVEIKQNGGFPIEKLRPFCISDRNFPQRISRYSE